MPEYKGKDVPSVKAFLSKKKKRGKKKKGTSKNVPLIVDGEIDVQELLKR